MTADCPIFIVGAPRSGTTGDQPGPVTLQGIQVLPILLSAE
jgi:hypothetical protein